MNKHILNKGIKFINDINKGIKSIKGHKVKCIQILVFFAALSF